MATRSDILADDNLFEVRWTRDPSLPFTAPLGAVQVFRTFTPPPQRGAAMRGASNTPNDVANAVSFDC